MAGTGVAMGVALGCLAEMSASATSIQVGYAGTLTGSPGPTYQGYGQYQTGQGGEFTVTPLQSPGGPASATLDGYALDYAGVASNVGLNGSFQTFCLEDNEYIYPYGKPAYGVLSDGTHDGGVSSGNSAGSTSTYDPLSVGAAWLYKQFATGALAASGYDYQTDAGRHASAGQLQNALWWLEDEPSSDPNSNPFIDLVRDALKPSLGATQAETDAAIKADNNGKYAVKVLNLTYDDGRGQDQIVSVQVPDGGSSLCALALGLSSLSFLPKRFRGR